MKNIQGFPRMEEKNDPLCFGKPELENGHTLLLSISSLTSIQFLFQKLPIKAY